MTLSAVSPARAGFLVSEVTELEAFRALGEEWGDLVERCSGEVFLHHEFLVLWIESFARAAALKILLGREPGGRLVAALPLLRRSNRIFGVPVRELAATANSHSCRFDLLAEEPHRAAAAFLDRLAADGGWDVLRLVDLPETGNGLVLLDAARRARLPAGLWKSQRSPYLDLPALECELDRQLSGQLRTLVRRRKRQLAALGEVSFERSERGDVPMALEECLSLEREGWKGRLGTACLQNSETHDFYRRLALLAEGKGWLSLYLLRLGGRLVAFQFGLTYGDTYHLLKLAYDERFRRWSPGLVLQDQVVRDCRARGLVRCDFLGDDEEWKRRWSNGALEHHWLFVFRDNVLGRLLRRAKFEWAPIARSWLRRETGAPG